MLIFWRMMAFFERVWWMVTNLEDDGQIYEFGGDDPELDLPPPDPPGAQAQASPDKRTELTEL